MIFFKPLDVLSFQKKGAFMHPLPGKILIFSDILLVVPYLKEPVSYAKFETPLIRTLIISRYFHGILNKFPYNYNGIQNTKVITMKLRLNSYEII